MSPGPERGGVASRSDLRRLLLRGDLWRIEEMGRAWRGILGALVPLTYDPDPRVGWRAVEATGRVADVMAGQDPEFVREHLRRLFWLITEESGAICWRAPELMASVVARRPREFGEYVPIITHLLLEMAEEDLEHFRAGILWAIGRLGAPARIGAQEVLPAIRKALEHEDPAVRGGAAWCLGRLGLRDELRHRPGLRSDAGELDLLEDGTLTRTTVARIVRFFLDRAEPPVSEEPGGS